MHYYTFNIGDYASHTRGLSVIEDAAYRRLIDQYYLSEGPIQGDAKAVSRAIGMREYQDEVEYVLETYFQHDDGVWRHERCDRDLSVMQEKSSKAKQSAQARWGDKKKPEADQPKAEEQTKDAQQETVEPEEVRSDSERNADEMQSECERNANAMLPNTQYPLLKPKNNKHPWRDDFEAFWSAMREIYKRAGDNPGAKAEAEREFGKIKPDRDEVDRWIAAAKRQADQKLERISAGKFASPFKHVCRWIKYECFNEEAPVQGVVDDCFRGAI